ncbi:hypothetical protein [Atopomonas sediminilitoris]|uniref:hypothetical protein n=1 Tax=Atopomonas sediminilitoris TaxID=2919919 RepID=UPI001F4E88E5|nr:hypothetical protein [Atopomonas sediminilitoris]MCJ8170883.1 hypothetical protein [Atopomonas sediminilitoris]
MSEAKPTTDSVIDFADAKAQRVHDLNEKRLQHVRAAFSAALPLPKTSAAKKRKKNKKTKR